VGCPGGDIPELNGIVPRGGSKYIFGGGVEEHMPNLPAMPRKPRDWVNVFRSAFVIRQNGETLGHSPNEDFAIIGARGDKIVVEGRPIGVENGRSMAPEKGYLLGETATMGEWDDGKRAASTRFPIHREIERIGFDNVRVPRIL
jgi:hypothetical protein